MLCLAGLATTPGVLTRVPLASAMLALAAIGVAGVSSALASFVGSPRAFHGLINLVLMPAWLLSGALFPLETASGWINATAFVNPVAWAHRATEAALLGVGPDAFDAVLLAAFAAAGIAAASLGLSRGIDGRR